MSIVIYNPVCKVETVHARAANQIGSLLQKRIGLVFNQHSSVVAFWNALEREVEKQLQPAALQRLYKTNTWAPAPAAEMENLIRQTDFALVGVGA